MFTPPRTAVLSTALAGPSAPVWPVLLVCLCASLGSLLSRLLFLRHLVQPRKAQIKAPCTQLGCLSPGWLRVPSGGAGTLDTAGNAALALGLTSDSQMAGSDRRSLESWPTEVRPHRVVKVYHASVIACPWALRTHQRETLGACSILTATFMQACPVFGQPTRGSAQLTLPGEGTVFGSHRTNCHSHAGLGMLCPCQNHPVSSVPVTPPIREV